LFFLILILSVVHYFGCSAFIISSKHAAVDMSYSPSLLKIPSFNYQCLSSYDCTADMTIIIIIIISIIIII